MTYSLRDIAEALAHTTHGLNDSSVQMLVGRLKRMAEFDVVRAHQRPGAGKTAPRYLDLTEAGVATVFALLADFNVSFDAFRQLNDNLRKAVRLYLENDYQKETWYLPRTGDVLAKDDPRREELRQDWIFSVAFATDASGEFHYAGDLRTLTDLGQTPSQRQARRDYFKERGLFPRGILHLDLDETLRPVLDYLCSHDGEGK